MSPIETIKTTALEPEIRAVPATSRDSSEALAVVLARRNAPASWLRETIRKLDSLATLEENWDSYGAAPISIDSIANAISFVVELARIENVEPPAVGGSPDGYVGFSWDGGTWSLDAEMLGDGQLSYVYLDERDPCKNQEQSTRNWGDLLRFLTQWT